MELKITNAANDRPVLWLYGVIGEIYGGISVEDVRHALMTVGDTAEIDVRIHSDGGSFNDSIAIHTNFARRKGPTHFIVDGKAYSGGSLIPMSGTTVTMAAGSWMMIHEGRGSLGGDGTADDHREAASRLDAINEQLVEIYSKRFKGSKAELRKMLKAETWLADKEAVAMGLADKVVDGAQVHADGMNIAACVDPGKFGYRNVPEPLVLSESNIANTFPRLAAAKQSLEKLFSNEETTVDAS